MIDYQGWPSQQLPIKRKTKEWRKQHIKWAETQLFHPSSPVRSSLHKKMINFNLVNNQLDMEDLVQVINPNKIEASYIPETIQHYPIMNSKLNILRGEELAKPFPFKIMLTNPNAISEKEMAKKEMVMQKLRQVVEEQELEEEELEQALQELQYEFNYNWQDLREMQAAYLINHYHKEHNWPLLFNEGFMSALTVGEEIYQVDIVGGEPILDKLNPNKVHVFMSGYSNKIEDADRVMLVDYWPLGKIIDTFYDELTPKDIKDLEELPRNGSEDTYDERKSFVNTVGAFSEPLTGEDKNRVIENLFSVQTDASTNYYDSYGNYRVLRLYWKSRRKIQKIKSFDPQTSSFVYTFHTEHYIPNPDLGEEATVFWINEAWEATQIAGKICIRMRPRLVQYNRISNPSRCHFGIIGSVYNLNDGKPFSLVDHMKPFNYMYNIIHDRLNKSIAANWGKILKLDLAMVPKGWEIDKWMYFAKVHGIAVVDSFKEGNAGVAQGKLAGSLNNNSSGVIDAETGNYIQQHIYLLEAIKQEMSEVVGITKQREGQIHHKETVGGVERSVLNSPHITQYYFSVHDDVKRRVYEAFLETAKIALRGGSLKFQNILPNQTTSVIEIDGDEFAEADYGVVVDVTPEAASVDGEIRQLAQVALQGGSMNFSSIMKILSSPSLAEVQRTIERDEMRMQQRQAEASQAGQQLEEQKLREERERLEREFELKLQELEQKDIANQRDNNTKLTIAEMQSMDQDQDGILKSELSTRELLEKARQFNETLKFNREKLTRELAVKKEAINKKKLANV